MFMCWYVEYVYDLQGWGALNFVLKDIFFEIGATRDR